MRASSLIPPLSVLVLVIGSSAPAHADIIERVVATVNDHPIFLSEVRERAAPFFPQVLQAPSETERLALQERLYREVLEAMIAEELMGQAAERMEIRITASEIDQGIANLAQQNDQTVDELLAAFAAQGVNEADVRLGIRRQVMRLRILNQRARGRVNITEEDVRQEYAQRVNRANRQMRFHASHVFFAVPEGATATDVAAVQAQAHSVREALTPENLEAAIADHGGGDLGWLTQTDLPADLQETLLTLPEGTISVPVRGSTGFHVFFLHERERGGAGVPSYEDVRDLLYQEMMNEAMQRQEDLLLEELEREAMISRRWGS